MELAARKGSKDTKSGMPAVLLLLAPALLLGASSTEHALRSEVVVSLTGGEARDYFQQLEASQYLELEAEQLGIDVVLEVFAPGGELLEQADSPTNNQGSELLRLVSDEPGRYRIRVKARYKGLVEGRFRLHRRQLRPATPEDRDRARAREAYLEARDLGQRHGQSDETSRDAVLARFTAARMLLQSLAEETMEASLLHELGNVHDKVGEPLRALATYRQELELWKRLGEKGRQSSTLLRIANVYLRLGDPETARDYRLTALDLAHEDENPRWRIKALQRLAESTLKDGETDRALELLEQALSLARASDHIQLQADLLGEIGATYRSLGQLARARRMYRRALDLGQFTEHRRTEPETALTLAEVLTALGEEAAARRYVDHAFRWAEANDSALIRSQALVALADIDRAFAAYDRAERSYRQALRSWKGESRVWLRGKALSGLAQLAWDRGEVLEALSWSRTAIELVEPQQQLDGPEWPGLLAAERRSYVSLYVDLLMRAHRAQPEAGFATEAFLASDRLRARGLLLARFTHGKAATSGSLIARKRELESRIAAWFEHESRQAVSPGAPAVGRLRNDELSDLLSRYREVKSRLRGTLEIPALDLEEIRYRAVDEGSLLLEYFLGEERSYLWTLTHGGLQAFELPPRSVLENAARRAYRALTARGQRLSFETDAEWQLRVAAADAEFTAAAAELSRLLLDPVWHLNPPKRLLVVTEGALDYFPFSALPNPGKAATPLIVEHEVINLPSATASALLRQKRRGARQEAKTLAIFADPVFTIADPRRKGAATQPVERPRLGNPRRDLGQLGFERLPYSLQEANAIASLLPETRRLKAVGFEATRELALSGILRDYGIVHFATHAVVNSQHPELSVIVLSLIDRQGQARDGFLRLQDLGKLHLNADLVVLSACRTALGKEVPGEGLVGLAHGFIAAGTPSVVASLWSPQDLATAELMTAFYRGVLQQDLSPSAALRQAQIQMWRQSPSRTPYHWAAFVVQGDGSRPPR